MKAAVLYGKGDLRMEDRGVPVPGAGEVLVRIRACGVCGTDAALFRGEYPAAFPVVIGHEFSGEVAALGKDVGGFKVGDRVTADPNVLCGSCGYCRGGLGHLCSRVSSMGVHRDGADAEYALVPAVNLYTFPETLAFEEAAFTEPLACAVHGVDLAGVRTGDTVLVLGAGGMGNLIAQLARLSGAARVVVSEPIAMRRDRALENGATDAIDPGAGDVGEALRRINPLGADVVFEVAGHVGLQAQAVRLARKGGTVVWFGVAPPDKVAEVSPFYVNENEIRILGSYNNPFATDRAVKLLAERRIRVDNLITHRIALGDYPKALSLFGGRDTVKLMVTMGA
ncbi:MAG TPA: zinc-dependent alcohol dehydrogenase family protein [Spirochaetia bacterium]|nr:zinc-dependent alcohol dehydrogenase family protein [Spirochaetales bacterium]HRY79594.1 zinc-dependent alcohol dehydrogenase family protein [Spirochaetia bacterium]HRZ87858.1 zinc-dependent alcohol dehydrogenase family protein [Spirochaetia bacterium]